MEKDSFEIVTRRTEETGHCENTAESATETKSPPRQALPVGHDASRFNALRHGVLSKHTVLPGENKAEYEALLNGLVQEHAPYGPTEEHLVEEIAGVIWRKRRLRLARHRSPASAIRADKDGAGHSPTSKSGGSGSQQTDKRKNAPPTPGHCARVAN